MTARTCPRCERTTRLSSCCGIDLSVRRRRWRMTADRVRFVHVLARSRKGLTEEEYRLRLGAVGVESCLQLDREAFHAFVAGLAKLPDCPAWRARHQRASSSTRSARG
jgi:hypothetical protein